MFEILNHTELAWLAAIHDAFSCAFMDAVMGFITATGNIGIIWIACAVLMLCFRKTRRTGITLAVALIFTVFLNNLTLKNLFARPRCRRACLPCREYNTKEIHKENKQQRRIEKWHFFR